MANSWGNNGNSEGHYFFGLENHYRWWLQPWNQKTFAPWKKSYDQHNILKSREITLLTKVHQVKAMVFSNSHVWMWELDHKECWAPKDWCFWTVMLEKTFESPLDSKEIKPVNAKRNQSWIFIGRTDAKLKLQYAGHLMRSADSLEKTLTLGRLKAGEGDDRRWGGWMTSPTQWTWVWASSRRWWRTGKPGVL